MLAYRTIREEWLATRASPQTRRCYEEGILLFERWAQERGIALLTVDVISPTIFSQWNVELARRYGLPRAGAVGSVRATNTARTRLMALRSLLRYSFRQSYISRNPSVVVPSSGKGVGTPRPVLPEGRLAALLRAAEQWKVEAEARVGDWFSESQGSPAMREARKADLVHRLVTVLAYTGCRVGEALSLRYGDVIEGPQGYRLRLVLKGGKIHTPYVRPEVAHAVWGFAKAVPGAQADRLVFRTSNGKPYSVADANDLLAQLCSRMGVPRITSHSIRATVATSLHGRGVPLIEIRDLLGHESVETTARYVRFAEEARHAAGLKIDFLT